MKTLNLCIFAMLAAVVGCRVCGESYHQAGFNFDRINKVAVLDVTGPDLSEAAMNQIADFFSLELLKKGYVPVERAQVQILLKEQRFQTSGVTTSQDAVNAGRILNVPAVLLINIPIYDEDISMSTKLVNVEDGSILWIGAGSGSSGKTLNTIFGAAAGAGAGAAVGGKGGRAVGGVAGGVLGGAAAYELSPQQTEQFQKIIRKVCHDLPQRKVMMR